MKDTGKKTAVKFVFPKRLSTFKAIRKSIPATLFYILGIMLVLWLLPEKAWYLKKEGIFVIGIFGIWRYLWQLLHIIRMLIYKYKVFPAMRKVADDLKDKYPRRLYFLIPSFYETPGITSVVFQALMRECSSLPCEIIMVISVGSERGTIHQPYN